MKTYEEADRDLIQTSAACAIGAARPGHLRAAALRFAAAVLRDHSNYNVAGDLDRVADAAEKVA
jgi:hypothetical protein